MTRKPTLTLLVLLLCGLSGCRSDTYDIDRIRDPVLKARFSCQYLLERGLALESEKDADGVLRRRIADFQEPTVERAGNQVEIRWRAGGIVLRRDGTGHGGGCAMTLRPQGRHVDSIDLDGTPLHAGFGM